MTPAADPLPALSVRDASRRFGAHAAVVDADLDLRPGRIACLLGPSGCGKSTLLRMIAGLESLDAGRITARDVLLSEPGHVRPPESRGVGLIFQEAALFPHLTVAQNVAFGLRGLPRGERAVRVAEELARVRLSHRADAWPHTLSGGEQQRAALARALARRPEVVLLDEPFSGLDPHLRDELRETVIAALRAAGSAALIVTHDAEEALMCGDELMLMADGRLLQTGTPRACYLDPVSPLAARLLGEVERLPAEVRDGWARSAFGSAPAPNLPDGAAWMTARPEAVRLSSPAPGGQGVRARVESVRFSGGFHRVRLSAEGLSLTARLPAPPEEDWVCVTLDPALVRVFARDEPR